MVEQRKKTGTDLAVRGEPHARAVSAERMRDGCDDADFSFAVVEGITPRGFAGLIRKLAHGAELIKLFQNFVHRHHHLGRPHAVLFQRHEFDETDNDAFVTGKAGKLDDLIFIEAAEKHAVDLDRLQPCALGGTDARQHAVISIWDAGDASKFFSIDGVHTDGGAPKAGIFY